MSAAVWSVVGENDIAGVSACVCAALFSGSILYLDTRTSGFVGKTPRQQFASVCVSSKLTSHQ